jgi:hypothetical protein
MMDMSVDGDRFCHVWDCKAIEPLMGGCISQLNYQLPTSLMIHWTNISFSQISRYPNFGTFCYFCILFLIFFLVKPNQHLNVVRKGGKHTLNFLFNSVQHQIKEKHKSKLNK